MRHRAGIGMSENSDAVVVIVSEETGSISVAIGGMLKRHLMPETLRQLLTLDAESWRENCAGIREYFEQFGDKLPHELREELEALEKAFAE